MMGKLKILIDVLHSGVSDKTEHFKNSTQPFPYKKSYQNEICDRDVFTDSSLDHCPM